MQRKLKNAKCKRKCLKCMAKWAVIEKCSKPEVHEIFAKPSFGVRDNLFKQTLQSMFQTKYYNIRKQEAR